MGISFKLLQCQDANAPLNIRPKKVIKIILEFKFHL